MDAEVDRLLDLLPAAVRAGGAVAGRDRRDGPGPPGARAGRTALPRCRPTRTPRPRGSRTAWRERRAALAPRSARELQATLLRELLSPAVLAGRPDLVELTLGMADEVGAATATTRSCGCRRPGSTSGAGSSGSVARSLVIAARDDRLCGLDRHAEIARLVPGAALASSTPAAPLSRSRTRGRERPPPPRPEH